MMLSVNEDETTDVISDNENEELEKYLSYIHTVYSVFGFGLWTVCLKEDPSCIVGRCGLQPVGDEDTPMGRIELGYLIDESCRGSGYASEACAAILQYGFEKLQIDEVYVQIHPGNEPSVRMARKLGFSPVKGKLWILRSPY